MDSKFTDWKKLFVCFKERQPFNLVYCNTFIDYCFFIVFLKQYRFIIWWAVKYYESCGQFSSSSRCCVISRKNQVCSNIIIIIEYIEPETDARFIVYWQKETFCCFKERQPFNINLVKCNTFIDYCLIFCFLNNTYS